MKKAILILLAAALAVSLCACSGGGEKQGADELLTGELSAPRFSPEAVAIPGNEINIFSAARTGDSLIAAGRDADRSFRFYRITPASGAVTELSGLTTDSLETLDGLSDGSALLSYVGADGSLHLASIGGDDSCGAVQTDIPDEMAGTYYHDILRTDSGYLFNDGVNVTLLDDSGVEKMSMGPFEGAVGLVRQADDSILLTVTTEKSLAVKELDPGLSITGEYEVEGKYSLLYGGGGGGELLALQNDVIYKINYMTGEKTGYADVFQSGNAGGDAFVFLGDGLFFDGEYLSAALWRPYQSGDVREITLAACFSDENDYSNMKALKEAVAEFNQSSEKYRIKLVDYGQYDGDGGGGSGYNIFTTDINAGNTPDIYDLFSLGSSLSAHGFLSDLKPFFDADGDISLEDMAPGVEKTLERNGELFQLVPSFSVTTMLARKSLAGAEKMSVDSFMEYADEYGVEALFDGGMTRSEYFINILINSGKEYIDYGAAACYFDRDSFVRHLEFASRLPAELEYRAYPGAEIYTGKCAFYLLTSSDLIADLTRENTLYKGDFSSVGFPSDVSNGVSMTPEICLGMAADSGVQDGVWAFFKYLLSSHYQWNCSAMPVNMDILSQRMDAGVEALKDPAYEIGMFLPAEVPGEPEENVSIPRLPADDSIKAAAMDIIARIDSLNEYDVSIYDIITSEAARYFDGARLLII